MTDKAISPLRRRLIEDMTIRWLSANTQHQYIRHVKSFADFVGRSAGKATAEDVHHYQLHLAHCQLSRPWYARCVGGAAARGRNVLCSPIVLPALTERSRKKAPWVYDVRSS